MEDIVPRKETDKYLFELHPIEEQDTPNGTVTARKDILT